MSYPLRITALMSLGLLLSPALAQEKEAEFIISGVANKEIIPKEKRKFAPATPASTEKLTLEPVADPTISPYNSFGKLFIADENGDVIKTCTAFYAGPKANMLATAASCLVEPETGETISKTQVSFVRGWGTDNEQEVPVLCTGVYGKSVNSEPDSPINVSLDDSYAFLYVEDRANSGGNLNLKFNHRFYLAPNYYPNSTWKTIIYQSDAQGEEALYEIEGEIGRSSLTTTLIQMDSKEAMELQGAIGGAWIDFNEDPNAVIGINTFKTAQFVSNNDDVFATFWSPYLDGYYGSRLYNEVFNDGASTDDSLCY